LIEITTFRLADGTDETAFLAADERVQQEFIPNKPGFARRTTARGDNGEWIVIVLWGSREDADAAASDKHPAVDAFTALIDPASVRTSRWETLD
jgi:hypothetical protein